MSRNLFQRSISRSFLYCHYLLGSIIVCQRWAAISQLSWPTCCIKFAFYGVLCMLAGLQQLTTSGHALIGVINGKLSSDGNESMMS